MRLPYRPPLLALATRQRWASATAIVGVILSRLSAATRVIVLAAFHGIRCVMAATVVTGIATSMLVHRPVLHNQWVDIH